MHTDRSGIVISVIKLVQIMTRICGKKRSHLVEGLVQKKDVPREVAFSARLEDGAQFQ